VFYRLSAFLATHWNGSDRKDEEVVGEHAAEEVQVKRRQFGAFARQAFALIDWLPARMTAVAFAIVGNFEDALYCWREQAKSWRDHTAGVIVAAGAGALGVKLGGALSPSPVIDDEIVSDRPEIGVGEEATPAALPSAIGLVWRALILWVILLAVVGLAAWVGI
jgi:cobalamin biosynthesis protein CobD/CbiB